MGFFSVEGLQREPWSISVYTGFFALVVILSNRALAKKMDRGANPFPMVGLAAFGYSVAAFALSVLPVFLTVATVGVIGFGIGSSAMSRIFSIGGVIAERTDITHSTFNAYMRATTSTSWMIGPALSFGVADQFGAQAVFQAGFAISPVWLVLWWWTAPPMRPRCIGTP